MTIYLSRLRIARQPQVAALAALLNPDGAGARMDAHHRLLWSAFSDGPQTRRDFLWRHDGRDGFLTLSARKPGTSPLFDPPQVQEFAPDLVAGDRLSFALRANATRTVADPVAMDGERVRKRHIDLVMDALHGHRERRAELRMEAAQQVATGWLARQGERCGFRCEHVVARTYQVMESPARARHGASRPRFGVLDIEGVLTVTDPGILLPAIAAGFGRAKAFGCGLMLIRRA